MQQYQQLGFRQPYQVLVDAEIVQEAQRCKIDLPHRLAKILQGEVKILITQCCIRQLYNQGPDSTAALEIAKSFERRRCGHHPDEYPEPLNTLDCLSSVVSPSNKWRYIVASLDTTVRRALRAIPGVPLVYLKRSVIILEPISSATANLRDEQERSKFRAGLKRRRPARPIATDDAEGLRSGAQVQGVDSSASRRKDSRKRRDAKEPNPLSRKKPKKKKMQP